MNREDITRLAQEAGFVGMDGDHGALRRFATLVASAEREACAEVCKKHADVYAKLEQNPTTQSAWAACIDNRDAIRARGNVVTNDTSQERVDETTKQRHDAPPQRTWVGLTDEEVITMSRYDLEYAALIGEVQKKLKEKNNG